MAAIFISHSSRDIEPAAQLKSWLGSHGYEQVFLDFDKHTGVRAGTHWEQQLYEEIARCHAVILILTSNWLDSKWCFVEFAQARALGKIIFPIVVSPLGGKSVAPEIQGVDLRDWNADGQDYLLRRIREISDEANRGFGWDGSRPPFPGIHSFSHNDAAVFFGRDIESREVIERLEARRIQGGKRLILIVGASGSGKSSLLRAGVLPRLAREQTQWVLLPPFRPERQPLTNFAKCLTERLRIPKRWRECRDALGSEEAAKYLKDVADDLRVGDAVSATVLISIDQFEEFFTVSDKKERAEFLKLLEIITDTERWLPFLLVGTARSDVLGGFLQSYQFTLSFDDYVLRPMPLDRVPKLVEGPAGVAALTLERGLSHRIAVDVETAEALPLLAFALRELYERFGRDRRLTIAEYEQLGDKAARLSPIENAVRRKAEDVINMLQPSPAQLLLLRHAFIPHLVRVRDDGAFVRHPARMSEIPTDARPLLDVFVDARLLSRRTERRDDGSTDVLLELSHEALCKAWPLLAGWLATEADFLAGKRQLEQFMSDWKGTPINQRRDALLQGIYLARARQWLQTHRYGLSPEEVAFIDESTRSFTRRRRTMLATIAVAALVIVLVGTNRLYAEYARRTALSCDLLAAEQDNNVHVPGVEFDRILPSAAIPACESAVSSDPTNPRLIHNLARSYDAGGQYEAAAKWYQTAADMGWAYSQNNLGVLYLYGRGVRLNFSEGVRWIRAAAEQNNAQALVNYTETDYTFVFSSDAERAMVVEQSLAEKGFLGTSAVSGTWGPDAQQALKDFKAAMKLPEDGATLRVLDRLGRIEELSRLIDKRYAAQERGTHD